MRQGGLPEGLYMIRRSTDGSGYVSAVTLQLFTDRVLCLYYTNFALWYKTRSQAVAKIADRTDSQQII